MVKNEKLTKADSNICKARERKKRSHKCQECHWKRGTAQYHQQDLQYINSEELHYWDRNGQRPRGEGGRGGGGGG
jgi:hypothetical protein